MVAACPKCKTRLKIAEEKIAPDGSRFKCPKCATVLLVRKPKTAAPPASPARPLDYKKVIVAHADPVIVERAKSTLSKAGYAVITSADGVDMMVRTLKELPGVALIDVALPKIYGFEVCKRLRERAETKGMRLILISSIHDKTRYRREPVSLYGADDYIDEHEIEGTLASRVKGEAPEAQKPVEPPRPEPPQTKPQAQPPQRPRVEAPSLPKQEAVSPQPAKPAALQAAPAPERKPETAKPAPKPATVSADVPVEKARRLIRAILSDIYLYDAQKVEEAIKVGKFREAFAPELKEGLKLYDQRVTAETKTKGDFFNEEIEKFIETRKKSLGLM